MKKMMLLGAWLLYALALFAQSRSIKGKVTDENGAPLSGVSIVLKETKAGVQTDEKGVFNLKTGKTGDVTLVISYTGYKVMNVTTDGKTDVNVKLERDQNDLDNVVVIGYGTSKRKDLTGAIASMSSKELMKVPVANASEALTGRLAGVQVTATEGSPDAELKIRVRGGGSITGDNSPLLIVDGFPVTSIADIAPADIESMDVLKDASSTAIYGSRGANGVIIITTKSGKSGKFTVNYNVYGGYRKLAKKLDVLSPYDYAKWQYERALLDNKLSDQYTKYLGNWQDIDLYKEVTPNDWQDQVFGRIGNTFNQNLSMNGGTEKLRYTVSYTHIKDKAIMQMSGFQRDNVNLKLNNRPNNKISIDLAVRYSTTKVDGGGTNEQNEKSSADSRLKYAMIYPTFPVGGLTDADELDDAFNMYHPLVALSDNDRTQRRANINLNGAVSWKITPELQIRTEVGLDDIRTQDDRFYGTTTYYVRNVPTALNQGLPAIELVKSQRQSIRNTNTVSYDFKNILKSKHHLNVLGGQEYIATKQEALTTSVHGFPKTFTFDNALKLSAQGKANSVQNYLYPDDRLFSFFGRANYDFDSKYLVGVTFRADGSSKFSDGHKWGYFPSVAAAWRISSEKFFEKASDWVDDLKLRVSYGTAGNNNIPSGQMVQTFDVNTTTWVNGYNSYWAPSKTMANPDLKWETTVTRNVGLDFTLKGKKLNGTIDFYQNNTKDLLILFPISGVGYDNQYRNMGETRNRGLELTLNWSAIDKKNFGLNFSGNIGFNKNKILSLGQMQNFGAESGWASTEVGTDYWISTGGSVGQMYGYKLDGTGRYEVSDFTGYNSTTGKWILKDGVADASAIVGTVRPGTMKLMNMTKDDNIINTSDKTIIGNANPTHTGGFTINTRVYNFDLSAMFNWSYGNKIYNANKIEYTSTSKYYGRNMITTMAEGSRWTNLLSDGTLSNDPAQLEQMNANTTLWSPYMSRYVFTDWAVEDGSFLRLGTLTVGYNLPAALIRKVKIQNCRFYMTGYNIFCITNYTGFDPEVSTRRKTALTPGVDYSAYPRSRMVVFGLNLSF
ncbi:SusC/RagA family TonB-linked outer membrane protein [Filimonas effusa]|uniref:TonB-dependent receptor n=1 Tax=Filimonas effusa TaxID=2508721 RepID=A0A4Q1DE60_9BACT|nr:TonB-dependent receptor [Filimonas effusa]RXK87268.1 TonB-dependent receptor [Filimonas effusa]